MKKILFVAMATIAFAGTSFAANKVVEKVEIVNTNSDCELIWDLAYRLNRSEGKSVKDSKKEADNAQQNCEDGSGVNGPVTNNLAPTLSFSL